MITKEQIIKKTLENENDHSYSKLLFATLDHDYQVKNEYTAPAGTIVQIRLYRTTLADLYINGAYITGMFPYDAATLLEE